MKIKALGGNNRQSYRQRMNILLKLNEQSRNALMEYQELAKRKRK